MKRSKVFLAVTACLLGVAAFAASRFHTVKASVIKNSACVSYGTTGVNATTTSTNRSVLTTAGGNKLYTYATSTPQCLHTLYTNGQ